MEGSSSVVWTLLLGAGLSLISMSEASPRPPRLICCVFIIKSNVTCHWEPGDISATRYTLQVQRFSSGNGSLKTFTCTTNGSSCTTGIGSSTVRIDFCITVIAHIGNTNITSKRRCQPGRIEAILPPVILNSAEPVHGSPECLTVSWSRKIQLFFVSDNEIKDLNSQIEFKALEQSTLVDVQVRNVTVTGYSFLACFFTPDTSYIIRLRNRYLGPASPWSPWSNALQGRTAEDAPSAAPTLWRQVKHSSSFGWRLVSLLWKPLPHSLARGRVVFYNVSCETENAQVLGDHGSCNNLHGVNTSCSLHLPSGRCSCALTASTSAGPSPQARIWIPVVPETEPPAPHQIAASPLNDFSLEVRWTSPQNRSVSGFVVEWFAVREKSSRVLHWEKLNSSCTKLLITEDVKPMERYTVSVKALYGDHGAETYQTLYIYTRQGAPSAGPNVKGHHISGSSVELRWTAPPVEQLHGFICNYTLFYNSHNQPARRVIIPGHIHHHTLKNMPPGIYDIFMQVSTVAGTGPAGSLVRVNIGSEDVSLEMYVVVSLALMSLVLMVMACLTQNKMVKKKLCQGIPDPSNSTLSRWTPETNLMTQQLVGGQERFDVKYSEVSLLGKLQDPEQHVYPPGCRLQSHASFLLSTTPVKIENTFTRDLPGDSKFPISDLNTTPCIYASISCCTPDNHIPSPLLPLFDPKSAESQTRPVCLNDFKLPADRASESSVVQRLAQQETCTLLEQGSLSDFSRASHPSVLFSHQMKDDNPNAAMFLKNGDPSERFWTFFPHVPQLGVDLSYCPVQCGPYMPYDV